MENNNFSQFIEEVLREASKIANKNFGIVSGTVKPEDNNQVLTETDLEIGQFIVKKIKEHYSEHNVIDEEAGVIDNNSHYTWVVDPIDGTSNFAVGVPTYGIMVGLLENEISIAGGIALPFFNEIYIAEKGKGVFCDGNKIEVSKEADLSKVLVAGHIDGHPENPQITKEYCQLLVEIILKIRNLRTSNAVYDVMMVAKGNYGATLNQSSKVWDNVAQQVIIEEAGGIYTDFYGKPIDYSNCLKESNKNYTFCAASPAIHQALQGIINK